MKNRPLRNDFITTFVYICNMDKELIFRQAAPREVPFIMQIIRQAQARMHAAGSRQWQDGYPAPGHISADIGRGCGYVLCRPGARERHAVIAYGAVVFDGEPAYEDLEGEWLTDGPYVVVHRIAVADGERGKGVASEFLRRVEEMARERGVGAFRIDTNHDNRPMLRLLERTGFTPCGKIVYRSGERLAFEKAI